MGTHAVIATPHYVERRRCLLHSWFGLPTTGIDLKLSPLITDLSPNESSQEWLTGGLSGPEGSVMSLVVLCIGCGLLLAATARKQNPQT